MYKQRASVLCFVLLLLVIVPNVYGEIVVYDFSAPQFLLTQSTPFSAIAPNIGPSTFFADFTANISSYAVVDSAGRWPFFSGQALQSQCFCAQSLTIAFNTPVYAVGVNFASVGTGFSLTLTSAVGSTSSIYGPAGGTLYFSSTTPFTWIQLGTGVFAIDNLTLDTAPPTPQQALVLLMNRVVVALENGTLTQDQADGLMNKLAAAVTTLGAGHTRAAWNQLGAFINQVNAFIRARKISPEEGEALIDAAEDIRARIGR